MQPCDCLQGTLFFVVLMFIFADFIVDVVVGVAVARFRILDVIASLIILTSVY